MENSTNGRSRTETIGIVITFVILILIIFLKAQAIKKENLILRDGNVVTAK